jgi:transcription elongation factor GreA
MATTFLTQEGYRKLQDELDYLRNTKRQEVANRLREAMEGGEDFIENAEYEAAKNEQSFVEGRIGELEHLLATARVIEEERVDKELVQIGLTVTIRAEGSEEGETYTIVGAAEADPAEGRISNESPLGKALLGHRVGDRVQVDAPDGPFFVTVEAIS